MTSVAVLKMTETIDRCGELNSSKLFRIPVDFHIKTC